MTKIKIFIASSNELSDDRKAFELNLNRINKSWEGQNIRFELVHWEDHHDAVSATRKQDDYNESLKECAILVVLYWTKMGIFTNEEFDTGYQKFIQTKSPLIYVYKKTKLFLPGSRADSDSRYDFEEKLKELKHFVTPYETPADLNLHFNGQLTKLFEKAQSVNANVNVSHVLTPPPFLPEVFLGREEELETIKQKLFSGNGPLLLVNGEGGIGKTSLAAQYYHQYQQEYAHVAWVLSEASIANALLLLAGPLGISFPEQMVAEERMNVLLKNMAELQKPCLLVIDNANETDDLETNYQYLRACSNFHILLTTRITEFEQAERYRIEGLPEKEALELFKKYYPKLQAKDETLFAQIRTAMGGNTLVLELLAKNLFILNKRKTKYELGELLKDLQENGVLALAQTEAVKTGYHTKGGALRKEKPEAIIGAMYNLGELSKDETALLSVFAVLPAENIAFNILESLLPGNESLENNLDALSQKGWVEYNTDTNSYKCSPVVQEITRAKNEELLNDCALLIDTLIDKLAYEPGTGHFKNVNYAEAHLYARYAGSIVAYIKENTHQLSGLCERVGAYHATTGNLYSALQFYEQYASRAAALSNQEPGNVSFKNGLAVSYSKLGDTMAALGNLDKALQFYEDDIRLTKEIYETFPGNVSFKNGLAVSYSKLGETWTALGNLDKALQYYEDRNRLGKELYEAYPGNVSFKNGLAVSYSKLGNTWAALGNLDKALQYYEDDARLTKELYEAYPGNVSFKNGLAISYAKLGVFYRDDQLDRPKAKEYMEKAHQLFRELHEAFSKYAEFKKYFDLSKNDLDKLSEV